MFEQMFCKRCFEVIIAKVNILNCVLVLSFFFVGLMAIAIIAFYVVNNIKLKVFLLVFNLIWEYI